MTKKQFFQILGDVRAGELNEELTAKLTQLVNAVRNTGKKGRLTLTIDLIPTKGLAIEIEDDVKMKLPEMAKASTLMFPTVEGNLQLQNPMQKSLDLTIVSDGGVKSATALVDPLAAGKDGKDGGLVQVAAASGSAAGA